MRIEGKSVLVLCLAAMLAGPALAQRGPGGGGRFGGGSLLDNQSVQKELKLTDDQIKKVKEITQSVRDKHKEELDALGKQGPQADREKRQELFRTIREETNKALVDVLKPEQSKRFKEITLKQRGAQAFNDEEVQKTLNLTDEQKDKIKTINEDASKEMRELFPRRGGAGGGGARPDPAAFEEMRKKMAALNKETMEKATAVLTDDQKKAWKDLVGAPFEIKFEPPQGRPGGGGQAEKPRRNRDKQ
jgi:Spy/CpxP family protein refolding chaperone